MSSTLFSTGFSVRSSIYTSREIAFLNLFHGTYDSYFNSESSYSNGFCVRSPEVSNFDQLCSFVNNHTIYSLLNRLWLILHKSFHDTYHANPKSYSMFLTSDTQSSTHSAQAPHFDWRPSLKLMLFLGNTTAPSSGGLETIPYSHLYNLSYLKKLRSTSSQDNYYPGLYDANKFWLDSDYRVSDFSYLGGNEGTFVLFNTDLFHRQSLVSCTTNISRIIRLHAYLT